MFPKYPGEAKARNVPNSSVAEVGDWAQRFQAKSSTAYLSTLDFPGAIKLEQLSILSSGRVRFHAWSKQYFGMLRRQD